MCQMPTKYFKNFLCVFSLLCFFTTLKAQEFFPTQRKIEKTRIQYEKQSWKYINNENFEVYYFGKNENLAKNTLQILEKDFSRMTQLLGYTPYQKVKVFVYPSQDDLFQSNSGISFSNSLEIKINNLERFKIEIAFKNDLKQFKNELLTSLASVYVNDMLYSGSVKDVLQNSLFLNVSDWFIKGICSYAALGETSEMNQFMFSAIQNNKIRKLTVAKGKEADMLGQSIWNYIVKMYGASSVSNILNLTRIIKNEQSSVASTLKKPFGKFLQDWFKYYYNQNSFVNQNVVNPERFKTIAHVDLANSKNISELQLSPDGKYAVFSIQNQSKFDCYLVTNGSNKKQLFFSQNLNDPMSLESLVGPKFAWGAGNTLYVLNAAEGKTFLNTYAPLVSSKGNLKLTNKRELKDLNVLSIEASASQPKLLMKVLRNGQVELGIFDLRRNRFNAIASETSNKTIGHWEKEGKNILFVGSTIIDTTSISTKNESQFGLYFYDVEEGKSNLVYKLKADVKDFYWKSDSTIHFFVNNRLGKSLLVANLNNQQLKEKMLNVGNWDAFQWGVSESLVRKTDLLEQQIAWVPNEELLKGNEVNFISDISDMPEVIIGSENSDLDSTTNSLILKRNLEKKARLERNMSQKAKNSTGGKQGAQIYENSLVLNPLKGTFVSDPIRGLGYSLQANMNDLMENHLIRGGIYLSSNLKNTNWWGEYNYLENRMDWSIRYDRKVLNQENDYTSSQKIRFNRVELKALYPFDLRNKLVVSSTYAENRAIDQINFRTPDNVMGYAGLKTEYQLENVNQIDENLEEGQRAWASVEFQKATRTTGGYAKFLLDFRKYIKIKDFLFFNSRISLSHIQAVGGFSTTPQTIMGGMDNWLFQTHVGRTTANPLGTEGLANRDVFMSDFAGPLRGFGINKLSGNSHFLVNLELHLPVKQLIGNGQERSQFINNLQLVGFTDIGAAWTGNSPFSRNNGFNTNEYGGKTNPFKASVTDFRNPFLIGLGVGARTKILGYYVKVDYAYGFEDLSVLPAMTYLSFGRDF